MDESVKRYACRYAVIRFVPFPETEEFVNIGIILACPNSGYFNFKLQTKKRHGRVSSFFPDVEKGAYREAIEMFSRELSRIQLIMHSQHFDSPSEVRNLFDSLVHPREAMIQFAAPRVRMAKNPDEVLEKLFSYYVERSFVTQEYKEQILERRIRTLVHGLNLPRPFRAMEIGDEFAKAHFPLVQQNNDIPVKAIKPFYLAQPEPAKIISHGGLWIDRLRRMRSRNLLPNDILFAVDGPPKNDLKRYYAFEEICEDLRGLGISTVPSEDEKQIVIFAAAERQTAQINIGIGS